MQRRPGALCGALDLAVLAGWVVSSSFKIAYGEVQGKWEPVVTPSEYERGVEILRNHDAQKARFRKQFYLLRNLLWAKIDGKLYRLYGSTPTGRSRSYSYYATQTKVNEKNLHIPCENIDQHIPEWLGGITVNPDIIPAFRVVYQANIKQATEENKEEKLSDLKRKIALVRGEEVNLARSYITGKITEETFDQLRAEWQERLRNMEITLEDMERETKHYIADLDVASYLLAQVATLYPRLKPKDKTLLLQILAKRIIVDPQGKIIDHELNSPFMYLKTLADEHQQRCQDGDGSDHVQASLPE